MSSLFQKKDPFKDKQNEQQKMRRNRRQTILTSFTIDPEIEFDKTFIINNNEKIHYVYNNLNNSDNILLY